MPEPRSLGDSRRLPLPELVAPSRIRWSVARSFECSKLLERARFMLGMCCLHGSRERWVAVHRRHRQHSDDQPDQPPGDERDAAPPAGRAPRVAA